MSALRYHNTQGWMLTSTTLICCGVPFALQASFSDAYVRRGAQAATATLPVADRYSEHLGINLALRKELKKYIRLGLTFAAQVSEYGELQTRTHGEVTVTDDRVRWIDVSISEDVTETAAVDRPQAGLTLCCGWSYSQSILMVTHGPMSCSFSQPHTFPLLERCMHYTPTVESCGTSTLVYGKPRLLIAPVRFAVLRSECNKLFSVLLVLGR